MIINDLLQQNRMSMYRLSKLSSVPQATISDICTGKTELGRCSAETLYKIAKVFHVTVDSILDANFSKQDSRLSFEVYKSEICHQLKTAGDLDFVAEVLTNKSIFHLFQKQWYPEAFYLLAMVDYLSRLNGLPLCSDYHDLRCKKLASPIYPAGVLIEDALSRTDHAKKEAIAHSIPEFSHFNIIEVEVRDIV